MNEYIITYNVRVQVRAYGADATAAEETIGPEDIMAAMEHTKKNNKGELVYPDIEILDEPHSIEYQGPCGPEDDDDR